MDNLWLIMESVALWSETYDVHRETRALGTGQSRAQKKLEMKCAAVCFCIFLMLGVQYKLASNSITNNIGESRA